ncbi:MAG: hypothetical protein RLZZ383_206 [Pseudomonadota bacterium]|jgi:hypothetical protein
MRSLALVAVFMVACGGGSTSPESASSGASNGHAADRVEGAATAPQGALDALTCGDLDRHLTAVEAYVTAFESLDPMKPEEGAKLAQLGMAASQSAMAVSGLQGLSPVCQAKALAMQQKFQAIGERAAAAAEKKAAEIEAKLAPEMKRIEAMSACMSACEGKPPEAMATCMQACTP